MKFFICSAFLILLASSFISCSKDSSTTPNQQNNLSITKLSGDNQFGEPGNTLSNPLVVLVTDKNGKAVFGQYLDFKVTEGSASLTDTLVVTNDVGKAETRVILGNQIGKIKIEAKCHNTDIKVVFSLSTDNLIISKISGDNQSGAPGDTLPIVVIITNKNGKAVSGRQVDFNITEGNASLTNTYVSTNDSGKAEIRVILGNQEGSIKIEAKCHNTDIKVVFSLSTDNLIISKVSGDNQSGAPGDTLNTPIVVLVTDKNGNSISGRYVDFNISEGNASLTSNYVLTNFEGHAETHIIFGNQETNIKIEANCHNSNIKVVFTASSHKLPPTSISIAGGNHQYGTPGEKLLEKLKVIVKNERNKPVKGIQVDFNILVGQGSLTNETDITDSLGLADTELFFGESDIIQVNAKINELITLNTVTFYSSKLYGTIFFMSRRDGNNEIYKMNIDGSNPRNITNNKADDYSESLSPDGQKIVFLSTRDNSMPEIYTMNSDGTNPQRLTNNNNGENSPSWSPAGTKIVFGLSTTSGAEIFIMDSDGSNQSQLTKNSDSDVEPKWSPDGNYITFCSNRDRYWGLYIMKIDGTEQRKFFDGSRSTPVHEWSPDGRKIVFSAYNDDTSTDAIYSMNSDGTNVKLLTKNNDNDPSWSSLGEKIVYVSNRDGNQEIYIMNSDGSNQKNLTNNPAHDNNPSWLPELK